MDSLALPRFGSIQNTQKTQLNQAMSAVSNPSAIFDAPADTFTSKNVKFGNKHPNDIPGFLTLAGANEDFIADEIVISPGARIARTNILKNDPVIEAVKKMTVNQPRSIAGTLIAPVMIIDTNGARGIGDAIVGNNLTVTGDGEVGGITYGRYKALNRSRPPVLDINDANITFFEANIHALPVGADERPEIHVKGSEVYSLKLFDGLDPASPSWPPNSLRRSEPEPEPLPTEPDPGHTTTTNTNVGGVQLNVTTIRKATSFDGATIMGNVRQGHTFVGPTVIDNSGQVHNHAADSGTSKSEAGRTSQPEALPKVPIKETVRIVLEDSQLTKVVLPDPGIAAEVVLKGKSKVIKPEDCSPNVSILKG